MIDLETYRRRTGSFCGTRRRRKKRHKENLNTNPRKRNIHPLHITLTIVALLCITVWCCSTIWTPTDSRHGKNRQRPSFTEMQYENQVEKRIFNDLRSVSSKLARAESHLNFFRRCKAEKVYPKNLCISDHLQIAFSSKGCYNELEKIPEKTPL